MDYDSVFRVVKESVKYVVGKERAGLGLALSDLPWNLGAFWQIGGNYIVMNEGLVNSMKTIAKSELEFNSFVYMILAHEYIHSLGFIDEMEARRMTAIVALRVFGKRSHCLHNKRRKFMVTIPRSEIFSQRVGRKYQDHSEV
ncbi:hypothetical protein B1A_21512 [mine drainage metagenome]|uniref:Uncharacterized protein n=1 Tax=mine drainage metagenome TaxID=410659 RepID=T0Y7S3_9ZZZZ